MQRAQRGKSKVTFPSYPPPEGKVWYLLLSHNATTHVTSRAARASGRVDSLPSALH